MVSISFNLSDCCQCACLKNLIIAGLILVGVIFTLVGQYVPDFMSDFVAEARVAGPIMITAGVILFLCSFISCGRPDLKCCDRNSCCEKGCIKSCFPDGIKIKNPCANGFPEMPCCPNGMPKMPKMPEMPNMPQIPPITEIPKPSCLQSNPEPSEPVKPQYTPIKTSSPSELKRPTRPQYTPIKSSSSDPNLLNSPSCTSSKASTPGEPMEPPTKPLKPTKPPRPTYTPVMARRQQWTAEVGRDNETFEPVQV